MDKDENINMHYVYKACTDSVYACTIINDYLHSIKGDVCFVLGTCGSFHMKLYPPEYLTLSY